MKRQTMMASLAVIAALTANSQNEIDALRYSQITFGGTARYDGMAGAFGALGADFSTLSSNPAGLGLYRKSEITFTPSMLNTSTSSTYTSTGGNGGSADTYTQSGSKYGQSWGNVGIVGAWSKHKEASEGGWQNFNMGFGYNQLADFTNSQNMQGYNYSNASMGNYFANTTNGTSVSDLNTQTNSPAYAAYNAYLINPALVGNNQWTTGMPTGGVLQSNSVTSGGTMGEIVLSFASNYDNKLYVGGTIGFDHINYWSNSTYSETALHDSLGGLHSFNMAQTVNTTGQGINIKLGVIYRVNDWFRVGLAAHSPTQFNMNDNYGTNITSSRAYSGNDTSYKGVSGGSYNYTLTTPGRVIGSLGFIVAKRGLVDLDIEYVDYTTASLNSSDAGTFAAANNAIQNKYQPAENIRLGAEWKLMDILAIRAGLAYYGNPYQSNTNIDASRTSFTLGAGLREKHLTFDLAYVMTQYSEQYWLYDPAVVAVNPVKNSYTMNSLMLTLGLKF